MLFGQFTKFWETFKHNRGLLLLTTENEKEFGDLIKDLFVVSKEEVKMAWIKDKQLVAEKDEENEAKHRTITVIFKVLLLNEEESFIYHRYVQKNG